jgi:hypothetical protein
MVLLNGDAEAPTVEDVLEAARRAVETAHAAASLQNVEDATVEEQIRWVRQQLAALSGNVAVSTFGWFAKQPSPGARAALLLALLELARKGFLLLHQAGEFTPLLAKPLRNLPEERWGI